MIRCCSIEDNNQILINKKRYSKVIFVWESIKKNSSLSNEIIFQRNIELFDINSIVHQSFSGLKSLGKSLFYQFSFQDTYTDKPLIVYIF